MKYTKEKRDKSKNRFKVQFGQRFDGKVAQYIPDFKETEFGKDNDLDDECLDDIKALQIDFPSTPFRVYNKKTFDAFFTSIGLVQKAEEMAINLANKSFRHSFITIGNILSNHIIFANAAYEIINTNLFPHITVYWYLFD